MIIRDFFEEEIGVELKLNKENKTDGKVKAQVNLEVRYKGNLLNNTRSLSGGERTRLSLALTLALARVGTSTMIFLDECIQSIEASLREKCVKAISRHLQHKVIVNVCHDTVEGYYDSTVDARP